MLLMKNDSIDIRRMEKTSFLIGKKFINRVSRLNHREFVWQRNKKLREKCFREQNQVFN